MCVVAAAIPVVVAAAASAAKAIGDYQSGQGEARALQRDASLNDRQTSEEESRIRYRNAFLDADAAQEVSGSGLATEGSVVTALAENRKRLELEALDVRYQGALTSAKMRANAGQLKRQSYISLASGLLGSAAEAAKSPKLFGTDGKPPPPLSLGTTKSQARVGARTMGPVY